MKLANRLIAIAPLSFHTLLRGFLVGCLFGWIASGSVAQDEARTVPDRFRPRPPKIVNPALIEFKGEIDYKMAAYFNNRMDAAEKAGVDLLIVEIDSPGGLKTESLQMARRLRDCDWAYTIALIQNEAISGGALVSIGCDEIFIDPDAKFGDAGEIQFDPELWAFRLVEPKIESYLSNDARSIAESKRRPPDLAEAMVDKDVLVFSRPRPDGDGLEFKSIRADDPALEEPWKLVDETRRERFLTLSGQRAVELGMAQVAGGSREAVATAFGFAPESLTVYRPTTTDSVVYYLNQPIWTGLLIFVGLVALYIELSSPGIGVGGLISVFCTVLFFWSRFLAGTSGWLEVILFCAGISFLLMEAFVIPGFGVSGFSGILLLFSSALLASQNFVVPSSTVQWNQTINTSMIMLGSLGLFMVAAYFISKNFGALPMFNRLVLAPPPLSDEAATKSDKPTPLDHPAVSVGDWGVSESLLRPAGRARFAGRSFDVISDGEFVDPGKQVRVVKITGNVITVATIDQASSPQTS